MCLTASSQDRSVPERLSSVCSMTEIIWRAAEIWGEVDPSLQWVTSCYWINLVPTDVHSDWLTGELSESQLVKQIFLLNWARSISKQIFKRI